MSTCKLPGRRPISRAVDSSLANANKVQHGGTHYLIKAIQPWDFIVANNIGFLAGNVIKYVVRYQNKNGVEDLKKARHYLDKLIEVEEQRPEIRELQVR